MSLLAVPSANCETSALTRVPAIACKAIEQLRRSNYGALRNISCLASDGVLTLRGSLPTYYLKQMAQEIASRVEGVRHVVNRIEVRRPAGEPRTAQKSAPLRGTNPGSCLPRWDLVLPEHTTKKRSLQRCWS
jgi:hypothetical protein